VNILSGEVSKEFFGGEVPHLVRHLLEQVAGASPHEVEALLWTAQTSAPECLPVYYLLYKFHARRREFDLAEKAAIKGIRTAARQAGLTEDWREVSVGQADFTMPGAARFWLFSLKALAFIYLRSGRPDSARMLTARIGALDPSAGIGNDVITSLLDGVDASRQGK